MHRIVVNLETGETTQVEYTPEEQAAYDAAIATQVVESTPIVTEVTPTEGV